MGRLLYVGTFGSDDPTRATMPFITASGALDAGHDPAIVLMGEAVYLANDDVVDTLHGVGFPPLRQLVDKALDNGVPIYFWAPCCVARGVTDEMIESKNGIKAGPDALADLMMEYDRVLSF